MLQAAANPDGEQIDVVVQSTPVDRRVLIEDVSATLDRRTGVVLARAGAELAAMSDAEWDRLVEEANSDATN